MKGKELVKDLVCDMMVEPGLNELEYQGKAYSFCSLQCRERFQANPHLYIGAGGKKAPRQEGRESLKRRRMKLNEPLTDDEQAQVIEELRAMMGVKEVTIEGHVLSITYDLLQATAQQIGDRLAEIGVLLGHGWAERLRRAFIEYQEETEIEILEVDSQGHHHCH